MNLLYELSEGMALLLWRYVWEVSIADGFIYAVCV